jgi:glutamate-5-semialdehyde dehydrogenase
MDIRSYIEETARKAKAASIALRSVKAEIKNKALEAIARAVDGNRRAVIEANAADCENGTRAGLSKAVLDRILLDDRRIDGIVQSVREIAALEDPVGEVTGVRRPQGFVLEKVRIPIGVVAVIYEARPNVTVDAAALCLKAGNAVVLRGGSDAALSSAALTKVMRDAVAGAGLPPDSLQYVERREHEGVSWLVKQVGLVDLVIPRGGESLIRKVVSEAQVPVIKHYKGVCHLYVDDEADFDMALEVVHNAKVQRPATCNALETLLVHRAASREFLPRIAARLAGVELRGCERTREVLPGIAPSTEEDYRTEYQDLVLSIKVVDSLEEAASHIEKFGSSHTDGILSRNIDKIERFVQLVDSAVVTVNASTRLSDGGVFGLGAEIGISTDKLHSRGPMGIKDLTSFKWVVRGNGDLRR